MSGRATLLIAEDDELALGLLTDALQREGYNVVTATNGATAAALLKQHHIDLVVSDVQMPLASGLELLEVAQRDHPETAIVLITSYADPGAAMDAIASGAADYLRKPIDIIALRTTIARALERRRLAADNRALRAAVADCKVMVGTHPRMLELYKQIAQIAPTATTVLIEGESGTGKELVARTIHERSPRANGPFVAVNCAAFADTLLESELFGHEKGAFTGAAAAHLGVFETASSGTIFLDEIGDVPAKMQAQLLRVLQEGEIRRLGSSNPTKVDIRVISASNRDLAAEVRAGRMREDLFYRLGVITLKVPPLRERGDDLIALTRHLAARHAARIGLPTPHLSEETLHSIRSYQWPGNVRELDNAMAHAVAMCQRGVVLPGDLPRFEQTGLRTRAQEIESGWPTLDEVQRRYISRVLEHTGHNKTAAAAILGIDRRTIQRLAARDASAGTEMDDPIDDSTDGTETR